MAKAAKPNTKSLPEAMSGAARVFVQQRMDAGRWRGASQVKVAEDIGIEQGTLSGFLRGNGLGPLSVLGIANATNATMDRIIDRPGANLAIALDYHRDIEVPDELVRRLRATAKGDKTPKEWWRLIEDALRAESDADRITRSFTVFPGSAPEAPAAPEPAPAKRKKARA